MDQHNVVCPRNMEAKRVDCWILAEARMSLGNTGAKRETSHAALTPALHKMPERGKSIQTESRFLDQATMAGWGGEERGER